MYSRTMIVVLLCLCLLGCCLRCYIAERTKNMSKVWKDVFADDPNRVVVVIQGQASKFGLSVVSTYSVLAA